MSYACRSYEIDCDLIGLALLSALSLRPQINFHLESKWTRLKWKCYWSTTFFWPWMASSSMLMLAQPERSFVESFLTIFRVFREATPEFHHGLERSSCSAGLTGQLGTVCTNTSCADNCSIWCSCWTIWFHLSPRQIFHPESPTFEMIQENFERFWKHHQLRCQYSKESKPYLPMPTLESSGYSFSCPIFP